MAKLHRLEGRVHAAEEDSEARRAARAHADELAADLASMTAKMEKTKAEREALATRTCEIEVVAEARKGELGFVVGAVRSLKIVLQRARIWQIWRRFILLRRWKRCLYFHGMSKG